MSDKDLKLLLKDLSARLSHRVKVEIDGYNIGVLKGIDGGIISTDRGINYPLRLVKPYLRPMSSMTEEEDTRRCAFLDDIEGGIEDAIPNYIDWLNVHHFDYRGLIEKGLALVAPEGMYNIKKK